ncbi:MAG: hypothetical protein ACOC2N_05730 [Spirochaetota bacterium]
MSDRRSRAVIRAVPLIVAAALLSACDGAVLNGLYFLETPRLTLVHHRFDRYDEWEWGYGPSEDAYGIRDGYFISHNGPSFAVTNEVYPGDAEVILKWQLWDSYAPVGEDNGFDYDFRIVLDSSESRGFEPRGPVVELKLFALDVDPTHALRVREDVDPAARAAAKVNDPAIPTGRGTLHVVFRLHAEVPTITARALDEYGNPFLEVAHEVPGGWEEDVRFFVEAVGGYVSSPEPHVEPRVIDSVLVLRPEAEA